MTITSGTDQSQASRWGLPEEPHIYQEYERRRADGDVYWDEKFGGWAVLSFAACEAVETDEDTFARWDRADLVSADDLDAIHQMHGGARSLLLVNGAEHFQLHGGLSLALTKQVRAIRSEIDKLSAFYASQLDGQSDFGAVFADKFPTAAITAVLGLPWVYDLDLLRETQEHTSAINEAGLVTDRNSPTFKKGIEASRALSDLLRPEVTRLVEAGGNLPAEIHKTGRAIYDDWSIDDTVVNCRLLYFAGSSSLAHMLRNMLYVLVKNPDLWRRLDNERERIAAFVDETLRVIPPVQARGRLATRDVELSGVNVRKGQYVYAVNGAANRDPEQFENPDQIDIDRKGRRHLAFQAGPRACPGTPTTRMETQSALIALLDRFASIRLAPDNPEPQLEGYMNYGYMPLHLIFEPKEKHS